MKPAFAPHLVALFEGTNISLDKPIILLGRHKECDVQIPSPKISRRHCCIALVEDHLVVRDLGSTNGIRINGIKVVEGNLQPDDELTIGNMRYQVKLAEQTGQERQDGVKAANGDPPARVLDHDQSHDAPMPMVEDGESFLILQAKPKPPESGQANQAASNGAASPFAMEVPDDIGLVPLEPPPNS